jgi:hypothetical protein
MEFDDFPDRDELDHRFAAVRRAHRGDPRGRLAALLPVIAGIDDDRLCQVGVEFLEELVDVHWAEIQPDFEAALREHAELRKALSCCWFNDDAVGDHLATFLQPGEDIGRQQTDPRPEPSWEPLHRGPIHDMRLEMLTSMLEPAARAGLENAVDMERVREITDPHGGNLLWPRFRCVPADAAPPPFYRCAVLLAWSVAVFEADLLCDEVDALPETEPWRIAALFKRSSEELPGVHELSSSWKRGDPRESRLK